jgi:hypothetical protein
MPSKTARKQTSPQRFLDLLGHVGRFGLIRPQELGRFAFNSWLEGETDPLAADEKLETRRRVAVHRFVQEATRKGLLEVLPNEKLGAHVKLTKRGITTVRAADARDCRAEKGGLSFREFEANRDAFSTPDGRRTVGIGTHVSNVVLTHFAQLGATIVPEFMMQTGVLTTGEERIADGLIVGEDVAYWLEVEATSKHNVELMRSFRPLQKGLTKISVGRASRDVRGVLICLPQGYPNNWFSGVPRARRLFALFCLWYLGAAVRRFPQANALLAEMVQQRLKTVTAARVRAGRATPKTSWEIDNFCYQRDVSDADFQDVLDAVFICRPVLRRNHKTLMELGTPVPLWTAVLQEEPSNSPRLSMTVPNLKHALETALSLRSQPDETVDERHLQTLRDYIDEIAVGHGVSLESVAEAWADKRGISPAEGLEVLEQLLRNGEYFVANDAVRTVCKREQEEIQEPVG